MEVVVEGVEVAHKVDVAALLIVLVGHQYVANGAIVKHQTNQMGTQMLENVDLVRIVLLGLPTAPNGGTVNQVELLEEVEEEFLVEVSVEREALGLHQDLEEVDQLAHVAEDVEEKEEEAGETRTEGPDLEENRAMDVGQVVVEETQ